MSLLENNPSACCKRFVPKAMWGVLHRHFDNENCCFSEVFVKTLLIQGMQ